MHPTSLPSELLILILTFVEETSDLSNIRLASHTLNSLVVPLLFRTIVVTDDITSANRLISLQTAAGDESRTAVQEIIFRGRRSLSDARTVFLDATSKPARRTRAALATAFSQLGAKFINLHTIQLDFHPFRQLEKLALPPPPTHFHLLQLGLLRALSAHPPPPSLSSLTLINLIPTSDKIPLDEDLFHQLKLLEISVLGDGAYNAAVLYDFWETSIASLLNHAAPRLTSLGLSSITNQHPAGVRPRLPFNSTLHFPFLTNLSLINFIFAPTHAADSPDNDLLAFILRHKSTLTHLTLAYCAVYGGDSMPGVYPRPWRSIFQRLQEELTYLRRFDFAHIVGFQYVVQLVPPDHSALVLGFFYDDGEARMRMREGDCDAYERLMEGVRERALDVVA
ncbi:hypothetical protein R3P38DRAFT_614246 [Favolaschia claudopus]|uniref:F-box domain-containing protein n=1 Tax=Favolaschia claudopus TaxID=2862362 RepID=A0AAW0CE36_9AGAR